MTPPSLAAEAFRAAFQHLFDNRGRGAQAGVAEHLGLHESAVNDILKGRKGASLKMKVRIGEHLLGGRVVFPWFDHLTGLTPCAQVRKIVELTNEQVSHPQDNLPFIKQLCDYMKGEATPAELYGAYLKLIRPRQ